MKNVRIVVVFPHGNNTGAKPPDFLAQGAFAQLRDHPLSIGRYLRDSTEGAWNIEFFDHGWYNCGGANKPNDFIPQVEAQYRPGTANPANCFIFCPPMGGTMVGSSAARGSSQSGVFGGRQIGTGTWALDYSAPLTFQDNVNSLGPLTHEVMHSIASGTSETPLAGWRDDNRANITHEGQLLAWSSAAKTTRVPFHPVHNALRRGATSGSVVIPTQFGPLSMSSNRGGPSSAQRVLMGLVNPFTDPGVRTIGTNQLAGWEGTIEPLYPLKPGVRSLYIWDGVKGWICLEYRRPTGVDARIFNVSWTTGYGPGRKDLADFEGLRGWYFDGRDMVGINPTTGLPTAGSHGNRSGLMLDMTPGGHTSELTDWGNSAARAGSTLTWPGGSLTVNSVTEGGINVTAETSYATPFVVPGGTPPPPPPPPPPPTCEEQLEVCRDARTGLQEQLVVSQADVRSLEMQLTAQATLIQAKDARIVALEADVDALETEVLGVESQRDELAAQVITKDRLIAEWRGKFQQIALIAGGA